MTTMTSEQEQRYRKAVRARNLTDPLGAMGFRSHRARVQRETRIRRVAFGLTALCFGGILGILVTTANPSASPDVAGIVAESSGRSSNSGSGLDVESRVSTAPSHTRTRGS